MVGRAAIIAAVLFAFAVAGASAGQPVPQAIADEFGAKCLGGQSPEYEISLNSSSTGWVLFLEGGGWCYGKDSTSTIDSCAGRGGFKPPSATGAEFTADGYGSRAGADIGGIMAADPAVNPDFYSWNKVFMHYCDGASFGGGRTDPITVKKRDGSPGKLWMRGRNNFNAVIADLQRNHGFKGAGLTEVILSGGSAGGLAVFYNLDHLSSLLADSSPPVRVTGLPDAGYFLDHAVYEGDDHSYREQFQGADPVWNVTGSGGTNLACLKANPGADAWKCLMAQYIAPHIETPIYVMNSMVDAWQMGNILHAPCIATPSKPCPDNQTGAVQAYQAAFAEAITAVTDGKPKNGVFADACYVHEQNVNYCSGQGMPNCVGWSPLESGSKKWGYTTSIAAADGSGKRLTPQEAFGAWYKGAAGANGVLVDKEVFPNNPSCKYLGKPASPTPPPTPPNPVPPPTPCADFSGEWIDNPHWFTPIVFNQSGCKGTIGGTSTYTVRGSTLTASKSFHDGLTGVLKPGATVDTIDWANSAKWERNHTMVEGEQAEADASSGGSAGP